MKHLFLPLILLLTIASSTAQTRENDVHLREAGTKAIFQRSTFAHGYRHGYEEGYHQGNIDANMGRHPRSKAQDFRRIPSRYVPEFGPRKSFEAGFHEGLKPGYGDGFAGRKFRAVEALRAMSLALDFQPAAGDPANINFDQGISTGYSQGLTLEEGGFIDCPRFHPARPADLAAQGSFCDGYHRGYILGHDDGMALSPDTKALSARR